MELTYNFLRWKDLEPAFLHYQTFIKSHYNNSGHKHFINNFSLVIILWNNTSTWQKLRVLCVSKDFLRSELNLTLMLLTISLCCVLCSVHVSTMNLDDMRYHLKERSMEKCNETSNLLFLCHLVIQSENSNFCDEIKFNFYLKEW